jgi:hypothetical protein
LKDGLVLAPPFIIKSLFPISFMINMIHYGPISTIIHMIKINTDVHSITTFLAIMGQGSPAEGLRPWAADYSPKNFSDSRLQRWFSCNDFLYTYRYMLMLS